MAQGENVWALEYNVGDSTGWIVGPVNYTIWAASNQFHVGDTLVFSYDKQFHNVVEVTKEKYDKCTSAAPLAYYNDGNTTVVLKKQGSHYYICGFPGHCVAGQKVKITVLPLPAAGPSPPPAPAPSPPFVVLDKGNSKSNTFPSVPLHQLASAPLLAALMWALIVFHLF
ncbi:hypothetical protein SUGI_0661230 [Cryptomeria japonica]|nr:hypothetical protein SUGI_0661230 [Cryptomeria japonica]